MGTRWLRRVVAGLAALALGWPPVAAAAAAPVALVGAALALGQRDGLSGDRLALAAGRFLAEPRRRVLAPHGLPAPLPGSPAAPALAPVDLPVRRVLRSGLVELAAGEGFRLLLRATGTSFTLRSVEEQAALVEAFARFLNALSEPVAILVRSEPADLREQVADLERAARALPHPALRGAAAAQGRFLVEVGEAAQRRETLLVLSSREQQHGVAQAALERRAVARLAGEPAPSLETDERQQQRRDAQPQRLTVGDDLLAGGEHLGDEDSDERQQP